MSEKQKFKSRKQHYKLEFLEQQTNYSTKKEDLKRVELRSLEPPPIMKFHPMSQFSNRRFFVLKNS